MPRKFESLGMLMNLERTNMIAYRISTEGLNGESELKSLNRKAREKFKNQDKTILEALDNVGKKIDQESTPIVEKELRQGQT